MPASSSPVTIGPARSGARPGPLDLPPLRRGSADVGADPARRTPYAEITEADLRDAARRVGQLADTEPRALQIRALVLGTALDWLRSGAIPAADPIFDHSFDERGLRAGIEEALRELARHSPRRRHRYTLVDLANSIRPPSWM